MSKTSDSWNQLTTTVTQDWNNNAFGVDLSSAKSASTLSLKKISGLGTSLSYLQAAGVDLSGVFSSDQYKEVGDAAASAALNYLNSKIQKIKDAWLTPKTITVKALLGEVAPYATNVTKAGSALSEKLKSILNTDKISDTLSDMGLDFLSSSYSSEITSAVSNLKAVQAYGNVLNSIGSTIKTAQKIMTVLEPILPVVEITSNFALSMWSGGASANEAANSLSEQVEKYVQQLLSLSLQSFRKLIYNIPISLPALMVGAINNVSIKSAVSSFMTQTGSSSTKTGQWLESIFSEKYYQETLNSLEWEKTINKSLKDTLGTVDNWSNFDFGTNEDGTSKTRGDLLKTKFLNSIVQNYMYGSNGSGGIVAKARAAAHIVSYNSSDIGVGTSTGGSSLIVSSTQDSGGTTNEASASSSESALDYVLNDNSEESPLKDEESIRLISKKLYESY